MSADLSYTVDVNTTGAVTGLQKLQDKVGTLSKAFTGLQGALAGLAIGALVKDALNYADAMSDLSDSTGIAIQNIMGFSQSLAQNGGKAEDAQKMILKLSTAIGDATTDSAKLRYAFERVGVSAADLGKLSEQDILAKTIQGLSKMTDVSQRMTLANELLGKSSRNINWAGVTASYGDATSAAAKHAEAVRAAGVTADKLALAMDNVRMAVLKAIKPIVDYVNTLDPKKIEEFVDAIVKIGAASAGLMAVGKAFQWVATAAGYALRALEGLAALWLFGKAQMILGAAGVSKAFDGLAKTIAITKSVLSNYTLPAWMKVGSVSEFFTAMGDTLSMLAKRLGFATLNFGLLGASLLRMIPFLGQVATYIWLVNDALAALTKIDLIDDVVKAFQRGGPAAQAFATGTENLALAIGKILNYPTDLLGKIFGIKDPIGLGTPLVMLQDHAKKTREELNKTAAAMNAVAVVKPQGGSGRGGQGGPTAEELAKHRILNDLFASQRKEIEKTTIAYAAYINSLKFGIAEESKYVGMLDDEVEIWRAQAAIYSKAGADILELTNKKAALKAEEHDLARTYDAQIAKIRELAEVGASEVGQSIQGLQTRKALEKDRLQTIENITKAIEDQIARQQTLGGLLQGANDKKVDVAFEGAQAKRNPLEKQMASIQEEARKAALEAGRAFSAGFEGMDLSVAQSQELADGLAQIAQRYNDIRDAQLGNLDASRTWEAGWKDAFDEYVEHATNAATRAGETFNAITSAMNSAIDNFVDNGKFSFADFASSLIKDMIKIEMKALAMEGLKGLFGEKGSGGGLFSAIGSFFGGFFADGGQPPMNKPSLVGEKGPELFIPRSAGTIVPNGAAGGSQQVINNTNTTHNHYTVNAVDAKSVAQLFAENRKQLLGTVRMAQAEQPFASRI
jgi:lambda family phage tail tape measure protein